MSGAALYLSKTVGFIYSFSLMLLLIPFEMALRNVDYRYLVWQRGAAVLSRSHLTHSSLVQTHAFTVLWFHVVQRMVISSSLLTIDR